MSGSMTWLEEKSEEWRRKNLVFHQNPQPEKNEWILSCDAEFINEFLGFRHGMNTGLTLAEFLHMARDAISYRRREGLESNRQQRHLITYDIIIQLDEAGTGLEVVNYGRTKFSGEQRLVNGHSIGIGGHLDWEDQAQHHEARFLSAPRTYEDVQNGTLRERLEELLLKSREGYVVVSHQYEEIMARNAFVGFLCDNEDPKRTGDFHMGMVSVILLPRGVYGEVKDRSNTPLPPTPLAAVLDNPFAERWTKIVAEYFLSLEGGLEGFVEKWWFPVDKIPTP